MKNTIEGSEFYPEFFLHMKPYDMGLIATRHG